MFMIGKLLTRKFSLRFGRLHGRLLPLFAFLYPVLNPPVCPPVQLRFQQSKHVPAVFYAQVDFGIDVSLASFIVYVDSFSGRFAAVTRCFGQVFPYVHYTASFAGCPVAPERFRHRSLHVHD